jgi:hypothetical protein
VTAAERELARFVLQPGSGLLCQGAHDGYVLAEFKIPASPGLKRSSKLLCGECAGCEEPRVASGAR